MRPLVTETIESLRPYEAGKPVEELARELGVENAIKLASNENPIGPSPLAIAAATKALAEANRYPDAATYYLREKLAAFHGVEMDEILPGNGSNEVIDTLIRTFTTREDHVVFAMPSFVVYQLSSMAHGVPFTAVPLAAHTHDLEAMQRAVRPETRLFFVANPNNPTGTYVGRERVEKLLREVPPEVIVVMDEAYLQYADASDFPDSLELRGLRERLVILRTFSKIHGLAALRVGYMIAPKNLVSYVNRVRAPFNVSSVAQAAARAALDDTEHVERSRRVNAEERARLSSELERMGVAVVPSQANFVYIETKKPAKEVYEALLRQGVIVRTLGPIQHGLRVTVGTPEENTRFLEALGAVLE